MQIEKSADVLAAENERYKGELIRVHKIFTKYKRYCHAINIVWAGICILIYLWR